MADRYDVIQPLRCADCPTGISITLRDADRIIADDDYLRTELTRQLLLDGWRLVEREVLCLPCHDARLARAVK